MLPTHSRSFQTRPDRGGRVAAVIGRKYKYRYTTNQYETKKKKKTSLITMVTGGKDGGHRRAKH